MTLSQLTVKSDLIGMLSSGLCLIHCVATPFLFMANSGLGIHAEGGYSWWGYLDPLFLALSFFAVYWSVKNTTRSWIKYAFGILWFLLLLLVLNEKLELFHIWEETIYVPTVSLVFLHFYNKRYCHCNDDNCCVDN